MPNLKKLLRKCNVPENLIEEAANSFSEAKNSARGLLWKKWKVRLFKASKIKDMLEWSDERLIDILPYRDWETDRKSTRLNSSHSAKSRMPSSA